MPNIHPTLCLLYNVPGGLREREGDLHLLVGDHGQVVARLLLDLLAVRVRTAKIACYTFLSGHGEFEVCLDT